MIREMIREISSVRKKHAEMGIFCHFLHPKGSLTSRGKALDCIYMDRRSSLDRSICIDRSHYCNLLNVMLAHTAILLKVLRTILLPLSSGGSVRKIY